MIYLPIITNMDPELFRRDILKSETEIIRVEISEFRGQKLLNIRSWYQDKNTKEFKPTQRGVTMRLEHYADLKAILLEAESEVQKYLSQ